MIAAQAMLDRGLPDMAAFHAQQAAEFALKALQIHQSARFTRTHDLRTLAGTVVAPPRVVKLAALVTPAYVSARYPDVAGPRITRRRAESYMDAARRICSMGPSTDALVRELRRFRRRIAGRYPLDVMILFGSQAKGVARRDSDVDLIVVSPRFRRKNAIDRAYPLHLEWDLGRPVDFLCYTPEEFNRLRKQITIVKEAVEKGIEI